MGATQSIPVVVEVLTITDSGQQGMAGGACELVKDINNFPDQYDIETANKHYIEVKLIQASSRVVFSEAESNTETTAYLLDKGKESWTELDDMCIPPSTGEEEHVIRLIRYGERGPQGGSRMTVAPPLIAGRAVKVAANGLATDSSTANTSSLDRENLTPTSTIAEVVQGWETGQANEWVSAVEIPIGVPVAGALEEAARSRFLARDPLTALSHPVSFLDHYRPHTEVNDGIEQVSFDDLKSRRETAGFIKEFPSSEYALAQMLRGHTYYFVCLEDGTIRAMTHEDARRVLEVIQDRGTVGHWSLVQPGIDSVTATGDIRLNFEGIITGFSCRSADFRIPLEVKAEHMGLVVPRHILTFESPTLAKLFGVNTEQKPDGELFLLGLKKIVIYSPTVFIFAMVHDKEPVTLQNAPYTVAFYETDVIRMIGFANQSSAQQVYDQVSSEYAKVFINKHGANILASYGYHQHVEQCSNKVLKSKGFLMTHGHDVTVPLHDAPYVAAFHQGDCIKMVGLPDEMLARAVYELMSQKWPKLLFDRRCLNSSHGESQYTVQCKDQVVLLPALDEIAPLQKAPFILAVHYDHLVRLIGFYTRKSAHEAFDAIEGDLSRVLVGTTVSLSGGHESCIPPCRKDVSFFRNLIVTAPLQHAPYVVALHRGNHVRMIGFDEENGARVFYDVVSNDLPKILMNRCRSQMLLSHGGRVCIERCKNQVLELPQYKGALSINGPYAVAYHQSDRVIIITSSTESSAQAICDVISDEWARVLMDVQRSEPLVSFGVGSYVKECREAVQQLIMRQRTVPLQTAHFIVAYHQRDRVKLIGFNHEQAARAIFDIIAKQWCKILVNRRQVKPLQTHGLERYIQQCQDEVGRLIILDETVPLQHADYIVVFLGRNGISMIGLSEEKPARAAYDAISNEWPKVLIRQRDSVTLATCGMDYLVRLCKKEVQRPNKLDEVAPLVKALYVVAFHSDDCVWLLGFFEKGPAQVMYDVLSDKLAKVLINREKSEVVTSSASSSYVDLCKDAILQLPTLRLNSF